MASPALFLPLLATSNRFAFKFLRQSILHNSNHNVLVSPIGLSGDFALLMNGASPEAQKDIASAFDWSTFSLDAINQASSQLRNVVNFEARRTAEKFVLARSLWIVAPENFQPSFVSAAERFHPVHLQQLTSAGEDAVRTVNAWISQCTEGLLDNVLDSLTSDNFVLVDATFFQGAWLHPFDAEQVHPRAFHLASGAQRTLPFMIRHGEFPYLKQDAFEAFALEYHNGNMYIFVPEEDVSISEFEQLLTPENWQHWMQSFKPNPGTVEFPRFKTEYRAEVSEILIELGLHRLFDDFASLAPAVENPQGACINRVLQAVSLDVDETGMKVASAGVLWGMVLASFPKPRKPFHIIVNRPFFFAVCDNLTKAILYLGVIKDPA
jgi:serine protease inhibitor